MTVGELASFIGLLISAFDAILEAPLHYRALERNKLDGLGSDRDFDNEIILSDQSLSELRWWQDNVYHKNGKCIRVIDVDYRCRTDASFAGWGAISLDTELYAQGRWSLYEVDENINYLELLAISHALQAFYSNCTNVHIEIQSDNVCAVSYVNDMGGMCSPSLDRLAGSLWNWCLERNIFISAVYIPGKENAADSLSREFSDSTEWMLKQDIFNRLCIHFFQPDIDLFASRLNARLNSFVSRFPEPLHLNAFTLDWSEPSPYIFPPFNLISRVMNKILQDKVQRAILVFPFWKAQSWFPLVLDNICSFPTRLPWHSLRLHSNNALHPSPRLGWGDIIFRKAFAFHM